MRHLPSKAGLAFSRPIDIDDVPATGAETEIVATTDECAALAAQAELQAIGAMSARLRIEPKPGGLYEVTGDLAAKITQVCVVSLEPFDSDVAQEIDIVFRRVVSQPEPRVRRETGRARDRAAPPPPPAAPDADVDAPDPILDDTIDLGVVAAEFLTLACDLYPRKPGVHFTDVVIGEKEDSEPSAFAALQRLKDPS